MLQIDDRYFVKDTKPGFALVLRRKPEDLTDKQREQLRKLNRTASTEDRYVDLSYHGSIASALNAYFNRKVSDLIAGEEVIDWQTFVAGVNEIKELINKKVDDLK